MPRRTNNRIKQFHNKDLLLEVSVSVDRRKWDESKYEQFIDELCGRREYQKEAILSLYLNSQHTHLPFNTLIEYCL